MAQVIQEQLKRRAELQRAIDKAGEQLKEVQQMQDMLNPEKLKEKAEGKRKSKKDD